VVPNKCCYFYVDPNPGTCRSPWPSSDLLTQFQHLLKNDCRDLLQTWHTYMFLMGCQPNVGAFMSIQYSRWPPWPLIGCLNFDFFSRTTAAIYSKLGTNVPYGVQTWHQCSLWIPTKYCYYYVNLKTKIAIMASDWLTSSQEWLQGYTSNLTQMLRMWSRPSVVADWLTHFQFLKNGCRDLLQTWHKCSFIFRVPTNLLSPRNEVVGGYCFLPVRSSVHPKSLRFFGTFSLEDA